MGTTIAAIATPFGRGGIGVVRLSGDESLSVAGRLVNSENFDPSPRIASLVTLSDPQTGETIDTALVTYFRSPASFTGEDVVEISCHGSPVILDRVLNLCFSLGARPAKPGEFSLRAVANGRIDLTEAEAIRDLINSQTAAAARQSILQMGGEFSRRLRPIKAGLIEVIATLETALEFVEDDVPAAQKDLISQKLLHVGDAITAIAETFRSGRLVRDGLKIAIVGRPNVGKSSLFNFLLGSERAIVTDIPGTTRDQLHERLTINGLPISLIDTAGLRDTPDIVEKIGVERSRQAIADADVILLMLDVSLPITEQDIGLFSELVDRKPIVVKNKIDIAPNTEMIGSFKELSEELRADIFDVQISAKTGEGIETLKENIIRRAGANEAAEHDFLVTDARHYDLLVRSADEIAVSRDLLDQQASEELVLVGLHNALGLLGEITGETTTEDILTRIFETFCIGK